nr:carboxypeptidase-like regulatory domain-containing protein [Bacteroidota bacterium]
FTWYDDNRTRWISANLNTTYSWAEDRVRFRGSLIKNFNRTNRLRISLSGGNTVSQFNVDEPISPIVNTVASLFFERNYMKIYDLTYARIGYGHEWFNGVRVRANLGYEQRKPLFNNTDYVFFSNDNVDFTSNNPLVPGDEDILNPAVVEHNIIKSSLIANISFDQKYMTYPDGKYNVGSNKYPRLTLTIENGMGASISQYNYTELSARIRQNVNVGNLGEFRYNMTGGTFLNEEGISFVDYKHFNGNQTRIGTSSSYTNVFNLLPYYDMSTNKSYFEGHLEHNFKGYILGKIPGVNTLNFNLVAGAHTLISEDRKPYSELSIGMDNLGWGKYRFLRIDYVHSFYQGANEGAFVFGLKFLGLLD